MNLQDKTLRDFKPGIYLHYKGRLYEADHLVRDANDASRVGVHYVGLELEGAKQGPRHLVRTWEDWTAMVHGDGSLCRRYKGKVCLDTSTSITSRFRYLGPFYEEKMLNERKGY